MGQMQFSLRLLLAAIAAVGIGAALWTAKPSWQVGAVEALLLGWVPASGVLAGISSGGRARAFWIGIIFESLVPPLLYIISAFPVFPDLPNVWTTPDDSVTFFLLRLSHHFRPVLLAWAAAPIAGLLCVATHWLLIRPPQGPQARGSTSEPKD